jgi:hypothetical protein
MVFALVIFNSGVSVITDSVKAISELASMYSLAIAISTRVLSQTKH